ncbi:hypothetical protein JOM56_014600 [Amanita muscaria]
MVEVAAHSSPDRLLQNVTSYSYYFPLVFFCCANDETLKLHKTAATKRLDLVKRHTPRVVSRGGKSVTSTRMPMLRCTKLRRCSWLSKYSVVVDFKVWNSSIFRLSQTNSVALQVHSSIAHTYSGLDLLSLFYFISVISIPLSTCITCGIHEQGRGLLGHETQQRFSFHLLGLISKECNPDAGEYLLHNILDAMSRSSQIM